MVSAANKLTEHDELLRWSAIRSRHEDVIHFLQWLSQQHGIRLDTDHAHPGAPVDPATLADEFFGIDRIRLEQQQQAMRDIAAELRTNFDKRTVIHD